MPSYHFIKRQFLWWVAAFLILLFATIFLYWFFSPSSQEKYLTAAVIRGNIENTITAVGVLQPSQYVDVGTQISGQLKVLKVAVGDKVKKGDFLAEIDPTIYSAQVMEATATLENLKAQLRMKEAQLILASQQHSRSKALLHEDAVSEADAQASQAAYRSARAEIQAIKAQIKQAEAALETAKANLGYTRILAPINGTVVAILAKEGQTLTATQQTPIILRLANLGTMTVWAQVSEADVPRLRVGQEAYFTTLGEPGEKWTGTLKQILPTPEVINNAVFYNTLFDVANPNHDLKIQMTAQVFFVLERARNALLVPVAALKPLPPKGMPSPAVKIRKERRQVDTAKEPGRIFLVQVLRDDGSVEDREVRVGVQDGVSAEILSGLEEGEKVVTGMVTESPTASTRGLGGAGKKGGKL